jgi:hypothetical protein
MSLLINQQGFNSSGRFCLTKIKPTCEQKLTTSSATGQYLSTVSFIKHRVGSKSSGRAM